MKTLTELANEDVISSDDIIELHEELTSIKEDFEFDIEILNKKLKDDSLTDEDYSITEEQLACVLNDYDDFIDEYSNELKKLEEIVKDGEAVIADWNYGATLIKESYFKEYVQELVQDCYPEFTEDVLNKNEWPYTCLEMDWEMAARDAKMDYYPLNIGGVDFYGHV